MSVSAPTVYTLTSDLAQFCLPAASRDPNRKLAYACSIYFAFLVIGLVGIIKVPRIVVRELPPPPDFMAVEIPQTDQPVQRTEEVQPQDFTQPQTPTDAPPAPVVVAPANANVPFAVPTFGNVSVTKLVSRASAPPAVLVVPPPPPAAPKPSPTVFHRGSSAKGRFPEPPFSMASGLLQSGQTVELSLVAELSDDGTPGRVDVKQTSGIYELDRKLSQYVKTHWRWDPGQSKLWEIPFAFKCN